MTINNEETIRFTVFLVTFIIISVWEIFIPRRKLRFLKIVRWYGNLGIIAVNSLIQALISPLMVGTVAVICLENRVGLFNIFHAKYFVVTVIISIVILDLAVYIQHVLFHKISLLWQLHKMHHTDLDIDVTTGIRFHPIEIIISILIKLVIVIIFGIHPIAVLIFEVFLNAAAMFNHGNIYIPVKIDGFLRLFIVTPDMHRVHHSVLKKETNSNYGFNIPYWDYFFRTYKNQPDKGHLDMTIGLKVFRKIKYLKLHWLLVIPFIKER